MAYSNYFRSLLNDNFKILTWVLIIFIAITPNFIFIRSANAANLGGWNISNPVAQGASTVYDATKTVVINGKNYVKDSWVKITPTASQVSKVLVRGVAGYALSVAVEQLLGAVDWVLDPVNNRIKYYPENSDTPDPKYQWLWKGNLYDSPAAACRAFWQSIGGGWSYDSVSNPEREYPTCVGYNAEQSRYDSYQPVQRVARTKPVEEPELKTLPLDVVSEKVISNAQSGDTDAKVATTTAAADIVAEAEKDEAKARPIAAQAESNATTKPADAADAENANEAQGNTKPNTQNPEVTDISLEFPVFCNWAPTICEAAQTVISFPQTLTNWWDTANQKLHDWANDNYTDSESTKVTVEEDNSIIFDDSQRIIFSNSCPTSEQFTVSFIGTTQNLEFSYQPLCQFMSMIKPFVIAGSYLIGAYIVMGLSRGSSD